MQIRDTRSNKVQMILERHRKQKHAKKEINETNALKYKIKLMSK